MNERNIFSLQADFSMMILAVQESIKKWSQLRESEG